MIILILIMVATRMLSCIIYSLLALFRILVHVVRVLCSLR